MTDQSKRGWCEGRCQLLIMIEVPWTAWCRWFLCCWWYRARPGPGTSSRGQSGSSSSLSRASWVNMIYITPSCSTTELFPYTSYLQIYAKRMIFLNRWCNVEKWFTKFILPQKLQIWRDIKKDINNLLYITRYAWWKKNHQFNQKLCQISH